jgi:hypothetical protein
VRVTSCPWNGPRPWRSSSGSGSRRWTRYTV